MVNTNKQMANAQSTFDKLVAKHKNKTITPIQAQVLLRKGGEMVLPPRTVLAISITQALRTGAFQRKHGEINYQLST